MSRVPTRKCQNGSDIQDTGSDVGELDVDDQGEIGVIHSIDFNPNKFASGHVDPSGNLKVPDVDIPEEINMKEEQDRDEGI